MDVLLHAGDAAGIAHALAVQAAAWLPDSQWVVIVPDGTEQLVRLGGSGRSARASIPTLRLAEQAIRTGAPVVASDDAWAAERSRLRPTLAVPLLGRAHPVGALVALSEWTEVPSSGLLASSTVAALRALVAPAALLLEMALRVRQAEQWSITDDLTGLYNARHLTAVLRRELRRATRTGRPLSVLFVDLDDFKSINDSCGHLAGGRALREAGSVVLGCARDSDTVVRFGGDEFAVVLPDTGREGALTVAERVRSRIARHRFLASEGAELSLTASIGVATYPDVGHSVDDLVQAADAAMYRVKARGKNGWIAAADRGARDTAGIKESDR